MIWFISFTSLLREKKSIQISRRMHDLDKIEGQGVLCLHDEEEKQKHEHNKK